MNTPCDEIQLLFDRYLSKDLEKKERAKIKKHLRECIDCRRALSIEKEIAHNLIRLPELKCSRTLLRRIQLHTTSSQKKESIFEQLGFFFVFWHRRIISVGFAVAVVTLLIFRYPALHEEQSDSVTYTQEEILAAREQARWSLAYVANTIDESEKKTVEDVFMDRLPKIVRDCIRNTVPLFQGGQP